MRYWFDTEFIENGKTIDLISIGIVAEDGREYYALNYDCDLSKASGWVNENVISKLPPQRINFNDLSLSLSLKQDSMHWRSKSKIKNEVAAFLGAEWEESAIQPTTWENIVNTFYNRFPVIAQKLESLVPCINRPKIKYFSHSYRLKPESQKPEIWAYYADYDWVAFCQIFGTMMDLPDGFPMYCRDIKQWCDMLGNPKLPKNGEGEHNALEDARWNRKAWEFLTDEEKRCRLNLN